nr:hypothetical protein [Lentilactobacillus otakiensis]
MLDIGFRKITKYSLLMYVAALLTVYGLNFVVQLVGNPLGRVISLIVTLAAVAVGGLIYIYLALKSRIADMILGPRSDKLRRLLNIQ